MTTPLDTLSLEQLRRRTSMKWRQYPPDVLPLWVAEMDVPVAEPVRAALDEAIALGDTGYARAEMYSSALTEFAAARWDWKIDEERTAIVPDVMLGIVEVLKLVTSGGDTVVINSPVYTPFYQFIEHMDRRVLEAPLANDHRIDFDVLESAFGRATEGGRSAAFLLCSPHNPTGTVHTRAELERVTELAARYDVRVVVDEIHAPVTYPDTVYLPYLSLPGTESAFSLMSASKAWNLAGLKAALALAGEASAEELARMPEEVSHGASHVGVIAHAAALRDGSEWLDQVIAGLDGNRSLLGDLIERHLPGVRYRPPEGTYLAWLDCRALGLGDDPAATFLERGRVAFNPGPTFGTGGEGHVRVNIATSPAILTEAVERMATCL